jgi:hypothetical protein
MANRQFCKMIIKAMILAALGLLGLLLAFFVIAIAHAGIVTRARDFSPAEWKNARSTGLLFTSTRAGMIGSLEESIEELSRQEVLLLLGPSEAKWRADTCDNYSLGAGTTLINLTPVWLEICYGSKLRVMTFRTYD